MYQGKNKNDNDLMLYWNSFLSGNDDAFSKIYEILVRDIFSFGTTFTSDSDLVKDSIQDVFIRIYRNRAKLSAVKNIKVYFLISLKNTLIDELKKHHVYQRFIESYDVEEQFDESEEERIIAKESDEALQNVVAKYESALTKRQREIIHYRFVDELTIEEISKLLNLNYQSIANTIHRSLKKIRNLYSEKKV